MLPRAAHVAEHCTGDEHLAEVSSDRGKGGRPVSVLKCMGKKVTESHKPFTQSFFKSVFNA